MVKLFILFLLLIPAIAFSQAVVKPGPVEIEITPPVVTEDEVSEEEKASEANVEYFFKVQLVQKCFEEMYLATQYAGSAKQALTALDDYGNCFDKAYDLWEEKKDKILNGEEEDDNDQTAE